MPIGSDRPLDQYANIARATVTQSGNNVETFSELLTGISLGQGMGMVIDQIDYYPTGPSLELLLAAGDSLTYGWTTSDTPTSLGAGNRTTLHIMSHTLGPIIGTPASAGGLVTLPFSFPFNPAIIIAAPRLFIGINSASLAGVGQVQSRFFFRYRKLSAQQYLELAETFVLVQ